MAEFPKYTIAVCNYNMADTLEESLRSVLDQLNEEFEVLVLDDGSTDESQKILDELEEEYDIFRWIEGENENIGEARAKANREAKGEYILTQLDVDDRYEPVIQDFVKIFEKLNEKIGEDFYLSAKGINMAPKQLLLDINYRSLGYGEDKDLWRRLLAEDALIPLKMKRTHEEIGYSYSCLEKLKNNFEVTKVNFQSGVSFSSFLCYQIRNLNYIDDYFKLLISPLAYLSTLTRKRYKLPSPYHRMGKLYSELEKRRRTCSELEEELSIDLKSRISEENRKYFFNL
jgi:glycosyltransferase involved in cell wall biosynthesis